MDEVIVFYDNKGHFVDLFSNIYSLLIFFAKSGRENYHINICVAEFDYIGGVEYKEFMTLYDGDEKIGILERRRILKYDS